MIKTAMLAACAAVLALAALPAFAGAEATNNPGDPYLEGLDPETTEFSVENEVEIKIDNKGEPEKELETIIPIPSTLTGPSNVTCQTFTGGGAFEDQETGWVEFTFHECKGPFGITCTTLETEAEEKEKTEKEEELRPAGTIVTTKLPFHLKTVLHEHEPKEEGIGVLITSSEGHFATFNCSAFFHIEVKGPGIIGTITEPGEEAPANEATIVFETNGVGEQTHRTVTNDETTYDLVSHVNGGAAETSGEDARGILKFHEGETPEILTTPEE